MIEKLFNGRPDDFVICLTLDLASIDDLPEDLLIMRSDFSFLLLTRACNQGMNARLAIH